MAYKVLSDGGQYLWTNVTYISTRFGCPVNSMLIPQNGNCKCNAGFEEDPAGTSCAASSPPETAADRKCDAGLFAGNPILPATGEKYRSEVDWTDSGPAPLSLERTYRSNWASYIARPDTGLGAVWTQNHGARLMATPALAPTDLAIVMPDGSRRTFAKVGSSFWVANGSADRLEEGRGGGWTYRRADDDTSWAFDSAGKLQGKFDRNGWITAYWYDAAGRLSEVTNPFGRSLAFTYNNTGQLTAVTTPEARVIAYRYDSAGRLSSVVYPGGKARSFLYENAVFAQALTGIVDESGARWASFSYDVTGRAISTELAGSAERYQVGYPYDRAATVTDPLGTTRQYEYGTVNNKLAVTGSQLPSGTGAPDARQRIQDGNGLITSETDFNGITTTTTWDVARRLPLSVTRNRLPPRTGSPISTSRQTRACMASPTSSTT